MKLKSKRILSLFIISLFLISSIPMLSLIHKETIIPAKIETGINLHYKNITSIWSAGLGGLGGFPTNHNVTAAGAATANAGGAAQNGIYIGYDAGGELWRQALVFNYTNYWNETLHMKAKLFSASLTLTIQNFTPNIIPNEPKSTAYIVGDKDWLSYNESGIKGTSTYTKVYTKTWVDRPMSYPSSEWTKNFNWAYYRNSTGVHYNSTKYNSYYNIFGQFNNSPTGAKSVTLNTLYTKNWHPNSQSRFMMMIDQDVNFSSPGGSNMIVSMYPDVVLRLVWYWDNVTEQRDWNPSQIISQWTQLPGYTLADFDNGTRPNTWYTKRNQATSDDEDSRFIAGSYCVLGSTYVIAVSRAFCAWNLTDYNYGRPFNDVKIHLRLVGSSANSIIIIKDQNNYYPILPVYSTLANYRLSYYDTTERLTNIYYTDNKEVVLSLTWEAKQDFRNCIGSWFKIMFVCEADINNDKNSVIAYGGIPEAWLEINWATEDYPPFDYFPPSDYQSQYDWFFSNGTSLIFWIFGLAIMVISPFIAVRYGDGRLIAFAMLVGMEFMGFVMLYVGLTVPFTI